MRHMVTSQRQDRSGQIPVGTSSRAHGWVRRATLGCLAGWALALGAGCERTPDPCVDFKLACLALTIDDGPPGIRRLSVFIDDGMVQYTQATPMKPPKSALSYPMRFAVRFGEFDNSFRGSVDVEVSALNEDYDVVGFARDRVAIGGRERKTLRLSLGSPPVAPDMADPPADLATPSDMASPVDDMAPRLDMP